MSKSFDRVADIYDQTRRMPPEAIGQIMDAIVQEVDPTTGSVLEVGIGTGRIAIPLAERGFRVTGVDISPKMLMHLRTKSLSLSRPPRVVLGDATKLPFRDNVFTAALAVHVFHLLDDLHACLSEIHRALQPNGCLLFGGDRGVMRYVREALRTEYDYGLGDELIDMLRKEGVKLADQGEVEKRIAEGVRDMGGEIDQLRRVEWDSEMTCGEIIGRIEGRVTSSLWNIPEDSLARLVEKLKTQLASQVGPPETVVRFRRSFGLTRIRFPR